MIFECFSKDVLWQDRKKIKRLWKQTKYRMTKGKYQGKYASER